MGGGQILRDAWGLGVAGPDAHRCGRPARRRRRRPGCGDQPPLLAAAIQRRARMSLDARSPWNGCPFTIVGVLPRDFAGPSPEDDSTSRFRSAWRPSSMGRSFSTMPGVHWITVMARLKRGQTLEAATAALVGVQPQIREASLPPWPPDRVDAYLRTPLALLPAGRGNPLAPLRVRSDGRCWRCSWRLCWC